MGLTERQHIESTISGKDTASLETTMGNCINDSIINLLTKRFYNVQKGVMPGVDFVFEDDKPYPGLPDCPDKPVYVVQFKSAKGWSNSSSWKQQIANFKKAAKKYGDNSYVLIGHYFGSGGKKVAGYKGPGYQLFGDSLWDFLTGYSDFYSSLYPKLFAQQAEKIGDDCGSMKKLISAAKRQLVKEGVMNWDKMMAMAA